MGCIKLLNCNGALNRVIKMTDELFLGWISCGHFSLQYTHYKRPPSHTRTQYNWNIYFFTKMESHIEAMKLYSGGECNSWTYNRTAVCVCAVCWMISFSSHWSFRICLRCKSEWCSRYVYFMYSIYLTEMRLSHSQPDVLRWHRRQGPRKIDWTNWI